MSKDPRIDAAARAIHDARNGPALYWNADAELCQLSRQLACAALAAADAAERQSLNDAPRDGTPIKAKIADWYTVAWQGGFEDAYGDEIGAWVCLDPVYPPSWTEGVCWINNEHDEPSAPILQARYTPPQEQDT